LEVPIELGGKREKRVSVAELELSAAEADVLDRERRLALEIRTSYAEALAAAREVETSEEIRSIDTRAARVLEDRVSVGDAPPLDLNLVRVEIERLASRITVARGRLTAALLRLKALIGASPNEALILQPELDVKIPLQPPTGVDVAVANALKDRPDIKFARLNEEIAAAGLRLARAEAVPNITAYTRFSTYRSDFDDTPVGVLLDHDTLLSFGLSITLPFTNRNQGAILEASASISQARERRGFLEQLARSEVNSAYERYLASNTAAATFEQGVIAGTRANLQAIQGAYEIGEFRITDLLTEQRRLVDSQREYTDLLSERYRALMDLQAAMGAPVN
jgi:cobalt-zinc-cadmium efflux system outer membrane protein